MATRKNYNTFSDQAPSRPEPDGAQRDTEAEPLLETEPLIEAAPLIAAAPPTETSALSDTAPLIETEPPTETSPLSDTASLSETSHLSETDPLSETNPLSETEPLLATAASKVPDNFLGHATLLDTYYPDKLRYYIKPYQLAVIIIGILSFGGATSTGFYEYYYNGKQILFIPNSILNFIMIVLKSVPNP